MERRIYDDFFLQKFWYFYTIKQTTNNEICETRPNPIRKKIQDFIAIILPRSRGLSTVIPFTRGQTIDVIFVENAQGSQG